MESSVIGIKVLAKFFLSKDPKNEYRCISRTLGKLAIVDSARNSEVKDQEIWLCTIVHETKAGKNFGVFILEPIMKIEPDKVKKLIPGFYYEPTAIDKTLIIKPKDDEAFWMLSKETRKAYSERYHTLIVPQRYESQSQEHA